MNTYENLSPSQKIRAALHRDVQNICKETCHNLGWEISKSAIEIVAELVYKKLSVYGTDLEAFAKHAKRTSINTDDVKLLVRRCPSLKAHLNKLSSATPISKRKSKPAPQDTLRRESEIQAPKQKDVDPLPLTMKELDLPAPIVAEDYVMDENCVDLTID